MINVITGLVPAMTGDTHAARRAVILKYERQRASKDDGVQRSSFEARRQRGSRLRMTPFQCT